MKSSASHFLVAIFLSVLILPSCMNDVDLTNISDEVQWNGSLAVPVGEATLTLEDLLAQLDSQNILITEGQEILYQDSDSVDFKFREIDLSKYSQSLVKSYNVSPVVITYPPYTPFPSLISEENINLGLNSSPDEERVDSTIINSAVLSVKVTVENIININPANLNLKLDFPIDKVRKTNGSPVNISFTPTAFNRDENVTISNFVINTSGNATGIPVTLKLDITTGSLPVTVGPTSKVSVELKFTGFNYKVAYGFFAPEEIATKTLAQDLNLPLFTDDGSFLFANPKAILTIKSNIGAYLKFNIDSVKAYPKSNPSQKVYASFYGSPSTSELMGKKPAAPGLWVTKKIILDKDYGATDLLFSNANKPDALEYKYIISIDNSTNDPTPKFITPDGAINILFKIQIPMYLKPGSYYEFKDTIRDAGEDINSALEDAEVTNGSIFLTVSNGLPVKGKLTLVLKDSLGIDIPTTFEKEYDIDAPQVDAEGYVVESGITPQKIEIALNNDQLDDFKHSKDIVYKFRIDSRDADSFIHFKKSDTFKVKLGLFVKGKVSNKSNNND